MLGMDGNTGTDNSNSENQALIDRKLLSGDNVSVL
jgi:hypothetical protein